MIITLQMLEAIREGDDEARVALVRAWGPVVLRWAARLGPAGVDPQDIAHDAMLAILAGLDDLRAPEAFPAWVFQITRRTVGRYRRTAWLRGWLPWAEVSVPAPDPVQRDVVRKVHATLDALPTDLREVLVLCDLEERTDVEAAAILDLPVGTLKSRLRRARAAFEVGARKRGIPEDA
jgi:RNA polymerase sigma factor (sigma-70 family)